LSYFGLTVLTVILDREYNKNILDNILDREYNKNIMEINIMAIKISNFILGERRERDEFGAGFNPKSFIFLHFLSKRDLRC